MEERKLKEIEFYNKEAEELKEFKDKSNETTIFELESFKFLYKILEKFCRGKTVLDYGCGTGLHSVGLVKLGARKVIGIDLSEKSLEIAQKRAKENLEKKVEFLKMDCEKMKFPDNFFDIVFDGGTFSSLDLNFALPEIVRVLKSDGLLIGIETFGHNPITNLKRKINKIFGRRTAWAEKHILKTEDLKKIKKYFGKIEVYYFHLISWLSFPFLKFWWGKYFLRFLEFIDKILLKFSFFKKYCFRIVFIFSQPIK